MRRRLIVVSIFALCVSILSAEKANTASSEYFICPTVGFGAPGVSVGMDFMYRHRSGFIALCDFNVSIPIAPIAGFIIHPEFYVGYSFKRNNLYVSFATGLWAGAGMVFYDYELRIDVHGKTHIKPTWDITGLGTLGIRNDYMYFFNDKMGITLSHTHGLGIHVGRWFLEDTFSFYTMMIKLGWAIRV